MRVDLFDFELPPERIALRPAVPRDSARLLVVDPQMPLCFEDRIIRDLPGFFEPGDALIVNDTRVIPARLKGRRIRGENSAKIEATLHKREGEAAWRAFVKPAKKLEIGETILFEPQNDRLEIASGTLEAEVVEKRPDGEVLLSFPLIGTALDQAINRYGSMPLPPYIEGKRPVDRRDQEDYQTIFARRSGAVAAPTASLHFTPDLLAAIEARGIAVHRVTLHVGAGTFLPVKVEDTADHEMHAEWGELDEATAQALEKVRARGGRLIAAGTTSLRIVESAARQNDGIRAFRGETSIFITPGYRFKAIDMLLTNFHLPRSTLFMLVAAFSGLECMHRAYRHAIEEKYRFYSYGDACLLHRAQNGEQI
jgi:S-adenosylmethionine:tRNA ribosyltransferase-isomerase